MLKVPGFLERELESPLLRLNRDDFLSKLDTEKRAELWRRLVFPNSNNGSAGDLVKASDEVNLEIPRIINMDVERTFIHQEDKTKLINFLTILQHRLKGDYHQALSYISGFFLLTLDEQTTMDIVLELSRNPKYLPGYFKAETIECATDSYVFQHILSNVYPDVQKHLTAQGLFPENYFTKWAVGLFTQILPPECLFAFFDNFLEHGYTYLFQFGLAVVEAVKDQLLKASDFSQIFGILRLDAKYILITTASTQFPDSKLPKIDMTPVLKKALAFDLSSYDFPALRKELFNKHLKERLERANQFHKKADDSEDESEDEEDEGEDCDFCHEYFPEYFCKECNSKICENCHTENKNNHKASHKVSPYEPAEEASEEEEDKKLTEQMKKLSIDKTKA